MKMKRAVRPPVFAALMLCLLLSVSAPSFAQVFISVRFGPPALPVYAQPICPGPGFFWTPGYWAWNDDVGYYWVPGTWVVAPVGMLWTPGYWGWGDGFYLWHPGYWGRHVGFYGGINYGYGYGGEGFEGGEWRGRSFYYNRSVTNVNVTNVTNVYNKTVIVNRTTINNVSYNGGTGGITARPTPREQAFERESHRTALAAQTQHEQAASHNRQLFASENHGRPAIAATAQPGRFSGRNVVAARAAGAPYHAPAMSPREARGPATNLNRPGNAPNGQGNAKSNSGFQKFGQPSNNPPSAKGRPGNANNSNSNWNVNRPGSASGKQNANPNSGSQKFGQPPNNGAANNNRPPNANDNWRGNASRQNQNGPRPAGQVGAPSNPPRPPRVQNETHTQSQPHSSSPPQQNAPKSPSKPPRENPSREPERHPGPGR